MITEEQARDAAHRLKLCVEISLDPNDNRRPEVSVYGCDKVEQAIRLCHEDCITIAAYFAHRDAERIERAKPIDAKWCVANRATKAEDGAMSLVPAQQGYDVKLHPLCSWTRADVRVDWDQANGVAIVDSDGETVCLSSITTRGQLLDLLATLKGGGK